MPHICHMPKLFDIHQLEKYAKIYTTYEMRCHQPCDQECFSQMTMIMIQMTMKPDYISWFGQWPNQPKHLETEKTAGIALHDTSSWGHSALTLIGPTVLVNPRTLLSINDKHRVIAENISQPVENPNLQILLQNLVQNIKPISDGCSNSLLIRGRGASKRTTFPDDVS